MTAIGTREVAQPTFSAAKTVMSPEVELLLCCCRARLDSDGSARIRALGAGAIDWPSFMRFVDQGRVTPMVYRSLDATCRDAVPGEHMQALQSTYDANTRRNELFAGELIRLTEAFEHAGVAMMTLKGLALAKTAYGDLALRQFWDLDLMFRLEDFGEISEILRGLDYDKAGDMSAAEDRAYRQRHSAYVYRRRDGEVEIDAHWRLLPQTWTPAIDYRGIWRRATTVDLGADIGTVAAMSFEDELVYLALHGSKEKWWRLRMLCDFAEAIRARPRLDWDRLIAAADGQGAQRILLLASYMAAGWLDAPVPAEIIDRARADRTLAKLEQTTWHDFHTLSQDRPTLSTFSPYRLKLLDRASDRLGYMVRIATFPQPDHVRIVKLPPALFFLYAPIKVIHDGIARPLWNLKKAISRTLGKAGS